MQAYAGFFRYLQATWPGLGFLILVWPAPVSAGFGNEGLGRRLGRLETLKATVSLGP